MRAPNALFWPDAAYLRHQQIQIPEEFCTKSSLEVGGVLLSSVLAGTYTGSDENGTSSLSVARNGTLALPTSAVPWTSAFPSA